MPVMSFRRWAALSAVNFLWLTTLTVQALSQAPVTPTHRLGDLVISAPMVLQPPKGARVAAGYLTITNTGKTADRLIGGSASFAQRFELHEMTMDGGVMKMRELAKGLEIKPGATVELKPGGNHLMFLGLTESPVAGKTIKAKLRFETAGEVEIEMPVVAVGADKSGGHKH